MQTEDEVRTPNRAPIISEDILLVSIVGSEQSRGLEALQSPL